MDDVKRQREEVANGIKAFMQDASKGECSKYKVSWSSYTKSTFDHKAFAKDNPDIDLSAYYKTSVVRPFKVEEIK
jgi:predicted phage-related endonuclease